MIKSTPVCPAQTLHSLFTTGLTCILVSVTAGYYRSCDSDAARPKRLTELRPDNRCEAMHKGYFTKQHLQFLTMQYAWKRYWRSRLFDSIFFLCESHLTQQKHWSFTQRRCMVPFSFYNREDSTLNVSSAQLVFLGRLTRPCIPQSIILLGLKTSL